MKIENLIGEIQDIMNDAKVLPLTGGKAVVETEAVLDKLDELMDALPMEIRQAKNIVADRSQIISEAKREADDIIHAAEERRNAMISKSEIVRQAEAQAAAIIADANKKSAEMRKAANNYVDDIIRKTDEAITEQLNELKKTRQGIRQSQRNGN
ncbi:MAG: ATPase [Acutalibacteraceae bacterium]